MRLIRLNSKRGDIFGSSGGGNTVKDIAIPKFQNDPNVSPNLDAQTKLANDILSGNLPSYYSNIGKANSPAFQDMIKNLSGQINQGTAESTALAGTNRSGVAQSAASDALFKSIPSLTYQDFLNSQNQQIGLLNTGINTRENAISGGLLNQGQENNFSQNVFNDQMEQAKYNDAYNANAADAKGKKIGSMIQIGASIGLAPFTGGASLAGLPGAFGSAGGSGSGMQSSGVGSLLSGLGFGQKSNATGNDPEAMMMAAGLL